MLQPALLAQISGAVHDAQALGSATAQTILAFVVLVLLAACTWLARENRRMTVERHESERAQHEEERKLFRENIAQAQEVTRAMLALEELPHAIETASAATREAVETHHRGVREMLEKHLLTTQGNQLAALQDERDRRRMKQP